ncbi:MFS transporter [bacterium]|nr:MFS transporter [bacterium]
MKQRFQLRNVTLVALSHLLHDIYSSFLAPLLPLLIEKLSLSYTAAGLLPVFQRAPSLINPLLGVWADRGWGRMFAILSPAITAICMGLIGLAPNFITLAILLFVTGISVTAYHVPTPVLIKEFSGDRKGLGMSLYMLGGELARTLGPLTILGAVSLWGLEGTWRLIPVGLLASLILGFFLIKADKENKKERPALLTGSFKTELRNIAPHFSLLALLIIARAPMKAVLTTFLPTFLHSGGASIISAGISLAILQFAGATGSFIAGTLSDKIGRKKMILISAAFTPLAMLLFIIVGKTYQIPLLFLIGFLLVAPTPVMLAFVHDIPTKRPAFVNSIFMVINFALGAFGSIFIGIFGDMVGMETTWIIAMGVGFLAIPITMMMKKS